VGVKVVADTHVLVLYLFTPDRLTDTALEALLHAENTDGIVVSAATFADLWYASRNTSSAAIAPRCVRADPGDRPRPDAARPFDRFILATALQLKAPLVTADRAIAATGAAEIVW